MTDTSTLREAANVPQTVSAIRIALDTINQQIDPAQRYVTIEDCLAYGKRILDAQTEQPNLQLSDPKVEGDAKGQTEVSSPAAPTDSTALVEAAHKVLQWDARRGYPIPYAVRDPLIAALASREAKPAPDAVAEAPTDGQLVSACLSYNHGYGLMDPEQRDKLHFQCREWWRSIARAINDGDRP